MKKIGLTIGKFAPFHKGHEYLIENAIKEMDEVYVMVYETDVINIPLENRAEWIKNKYPSVKIIYAYNPPKKYGMDEESIKIQTQYINEKVKDIPVTHFYSCEPYGKCVAEEFNIEERTLDKIEQKIPLSASIIRANLENYRQYINDEVYNTILEQNQSKIVGLKKEKY